MTVTKPAFIDLVHWLRYGRGRSLQFFATNEEVASWLTVELPAKYAPYELVGIDGIKEGKQYVAHPFTCNPTEFMKCISSPLGHRSQFWVWSKVLTPDLDFASGMSFPKYASLSGLVLIQHGALIQVRNPRDPQITKYIDVSSIGIVDRIVRPDTESIYEHSEYLEIYKSLHRTIKKELVFSSLVRFADGHEEEDTRLGLMTLGAVQAYEAGKPFLNRPGRSLLG